MADIPATELIETTFESINDAIFVVALPERDIAMCNTAAAEMFGWKRDALTGANTRVLHADEESWERFHNESIGPLQTQGYYRGRYRMKRAGGTTFPTEHMVSFLDHPADESPAYAVSVVRDITEQRRYERAIEVVNQTSAAIIGAEDFEAALEQALERLGLLLEWDLAEAWVPSLEAPESGPLELRATWMRPECRSNDDWAERIEAFLEERRREPSRSLHGLPGRCRSGRTSLWVRSLADASWHGDAPAMSAAGLRSAFAVPVFDEEEMVAVLVWYATRPVEQDSTVVELAETVADKLGTFLHRRNTEEALRDERDRFDLVASNIDEILWMSDPDKKEVTFLNEAYERIWGRTRESALADGTSWLEAVHEEDRGRVREAVRHQAEGCYDETYRIVRPDGEVRWVRDRAYPIERDGRVDQIVGVARDITRRKEFEEKLARRTMRDGLTGLANRRLFRKQLEHGLRRAEQSDDLLAVVFLDLNRFQVVNNTLGHAAGDELLRRVAERLVDFHDDHVLVARFGADEFVVMYEDVDDSEVPRRRCRKLLGALADPCEVAGTVIHPEVSAGIAMSEPGERGVDDLLRYAELALGKAKQNEGTTISTYDPVGDASYTRQLYRENALRRAVDNREFVLRYQPVVDLQTGEAVGVEALVRWDHPKRGILSPGQFLGLAEETGLIVPIGYQVLEEATRRLSRWFDSYPATVEQRDFRLAVNLSPTQYRADDVVDRIGGIVDDAQMSLDQLVVEITEHILVTGEGRLAPLRDRGLRIAIDDFGTGFASLQYLRQLDADVLKIDRSFIQELESEERDQILVGTMLELGEKFGLEVIIEGVETADQASLLGRMGGQFAQGYHFARPMDAAAFEKRYFEHAE